VADAGDHGNRAAIRVVKQRVEDELLARPGVNAIDIREKVTGGRPTGQLAIVVSVDDKKPKRALKASDLIPEEIDGIPTDVVEERVVLHAASALATEVAPLVDTTKYTTLKGGISMGPCRSVHLEPPDVPVAGNYIFVGTFGAIVEDRVTRAQMALTNFHVASVDAGWSVGDTMAQPGRVDGGTCPADIFGTLTRAVLSDHVDGAVVSINAAASTDCSIQDIGDVKGQAAGTVGLPVRKRGRTTGLTYGSVESIDATVSIDYGDGLGVHTLKDQLRIQVDAAQSPKFSDHGDSGSVVVTSDNKVIGLLFAGIDVPSNPALSGTKSFVNPIQFALDELNVDLCVKPFVVLTKPILCDPIVTKPLMCNILTKPAICPIVTKGALCDILTKPSMCNIVTSACPPRSLVCGPGPLDPGTPGESLSGRGISGGEVQGLYGTPGADAADDAFWLGYYTALEAVAQAEQSEKE
jgi:hypothetical protein